MTAAAPAPNRTVTTVRPSARRPQRHRAHRSSAPAHHVAPPDVMAPTAAASHTGDSSRDSLLAIAGALLLAFAAAGAAVTAREVRT